MVMDLSAETISTHALREEGDDIPPAQQMYPGISTHALREEGDCPVPAANSPAYHFYPRPPRGGRRQRTLDADAQIGISTHALREEGDQKSQHPDHRTPISTHALREEGDCSWRMRSPPGSNFYPRPPRGGQRHRCLSQEPPGRFLPTPSARRATPRQYWLCADHRNFYPRPPRGGRPDRR